MPTLSLRSWLPFAAAGLLASGCSSDGGTNPPPTPTAIAIVSGNNQTAVVNGLLPQPLVVRVEDAAGTDYPGVTVVWSVIAGSGTLGNLSSTTDTNGEARTQYVVGPNPGTNLVAAAVQNSPLSVTFTATAQSPPTDNTPSEIFLVSGNNQSAAAGAPLTDPLVAEVRNAAGTPLAGVAVTWTVTAGGGALGAATTTTGADGRTANTYTVGSAGTNTVTAAVQSKPALTVTFNATGS